MEMPEYDNALSILNAAYAEQKKILADKIRPIFFAKFEEVFNNFPEIDGFSWNISTDVYDDENYHNEVEYVRVHIDFDYIGIKDIGLNDCYTYEDCAVFSEPSKIVNDYSMGIFDVNEMRWYDEVRRSQIQLDAIEQLGVWYDLIVKLGRERVDLVDRTIKDIGLFITGSGFEFNDNVFGSNVKVTVDRNGFTVESK